MEEKDRVSMALAAFDALNQRDLDAFLEILDEDATFEFPGTSLLAGTHAGKKGIRRFLRRMTIAVPDLRFAIRHSLASGHMVVLEWTNKGTTMKGEPYENKGVTVIEFDGDLVIRLRDYLDTERLNG
jgi:ketosteroid isomerase-like protein